VFVSESFAREHHLPLRALQRHTAARLPNGAKIPITHSCRVPLSIGPAFSATVNAYCLPLHSNVDVILGTPWLHASDAITFARARCVSVQHGGKRVFLYETTSRHDSSPPPSTRHGASMGSAGAERRSRATLPAAPLPAAATPLDFSETSPPGGPPAATSEKRPSSRPQPSPPPASPDIMRVHAAALSNVEVLSAKQWRRALASGTIQADDVLLLHVTSALDVIATTSDDQPAALFSIAEHMASEHDRLAAIDAELPSKLAALLHGFQDQFKNFPDTLPPLDPELLQKINFTGDAPVAGRPYRLSPVQLAACREQITKLVAAGLVRPAASPFAAPVLMVPKPSKPGEPSQWRLTVDYRALNSKIQSDSFPIPHPTDIFNELAGHKFYSRLDLASGFWQIRMDPADEDKIAFVAPTLGQFAWRVLPMGIKTAPAVFARMMQKVLRPYLGKFCVTYLDDIGIYSDSLEDHLEHIRLVLAALREHNLFAKLSKCAFALSEMEFLGHLVSSDGIKVDPAKISAVTDWPQPTNSSDVRAFLGLANYYRDFVPDFSQLAAPLTDLLSSKVPFLWTQAPQKAFNDLKAALTSAPVLQPYRSNRQITLVMSDASSAGLGAVLMQADANGLLRPVAYHSRKLSPAERNYTTREQELLAIVDALRTWRHYLLGIPFDLQTDHASLRYLQTQPHLSGRLVRWAEFLQEYDFSIAHIPGKSNVVADALSRRADFMAPPFMTCPRPDLAADPETPLLAALSAAVHDTRAAILKAQRLDATCVQIRHQLQLHATIPAAPIHQAYRLSENEDPERQELLWVGTSTPRLYVPPEPSHLRIALLRDAHDSAYGAHFGLDKTYARLVSSWYWPGMYAQTRCFVQSCHACLGNKSSNRAPAGLARPLPPPSRPWTHVGLDLSGPHPTSASGNAWLAVFVDHYTKQVHLAAVPGNDSSPLTAERLAAVFFSTVVKHHGLPDALISDRGPQWLSSFWSSVFALCGTKLRFSTAYHPQTDGASERAIRTVVDTIRCCLDGVHERWDAHIDAVELAYNSSVNASTGMTPFEILYGANPRLPLDVDLEPPPADAAGTFVASREAARLRASDAIMQALLRQAVQIDKHRRAANLKVGDQVWLSTAHLNLAYPNKFTPKYLGPFAVTQVMSSGNAVKLDMPPAIRVSTSTFNASQLREHVLRPATLGPSAPPQPPPAFIDPAGAASYHIEKIVAHEVLRSGVRYSIRWKGFGPAHDSWDSEPCLLQQHGGRVAVALYRARRAAVDQYARYAKRRAKHGRDAQLPSLSPADSRRVAAALRDYELAQAAAPQRRSARRSARP
jgi:hypothetical protein